MVPTHASPSDIEGLTDEDLHQAFTQVAFDLDSLDDEEAEDA
jgi:hypothetical protein